MPTPPNMTCPNGMAPTCQRIPPPGGVQPPIITPLDPIAMYASATVTAGGQAPVNSQALANITGQYIQVRQIILNVHSSFQLFGMGIAVQLSAGKTAITQGFIPLDLLDSKRYLSNLNVVYDTSGSSYQTIYDMELADPMLLPPGAGLSCTFQWPGGGGTGAISCYVVVVGNTCQLNRNPVTSTVPYIFGMATPSFTINNTAETLVSAESELQNKSGLPVRVKKIVGKACVLDANLSTYSPNSPDLGSEVLTVMMVGSGGESIIEDLVQFSVAFTNNTQYIPADYSIARDAYYTVTVKKAGTTATNIANLIGQAAVSIVGSREVNIGSL